MLIEYRNNDEWSGFANLLANLIEKYAAVLDIENLPEPPICLDCISSGVYDASKQSINSIERTKLR